VTAETHYYAKESFSRAS